jgi:hypothetical protein
LFRIVTDVVDDGACRASADSDERRCLVVADFTDVAGVVVATDVVSSIIELPRSNIFVFIVVFIGNNDGSATDGCTRSAVLLC